MKKLYIKFLIISLLSFVSEQTLASWRKAATGSAALVGTALAGYYGNDQNQQFMNPTINQEINPVLNLQPTDYKKDNPLFFEEKNKIPYPQAKASMNLKIEKTQFGTAGLHAATKKLLEEMNIEDQDEDDEDSIEGLKWSQLISNEQRIAYLHNAVEPDVAKNFNYPLVVNYLVRMVPNDKECDLFFKKLHEFSRKDSSKIITMNSVDQAFAYMCIDRVNQAMGRGIIGKDDQQAVDELIKVNERELRNILKMNPKQELEFAWHEASHAWEVVCAGRFLTLSQLSLGAQGLLGGAFIAIQQFQPKVANSAKNRFYNHSEKLNFVKSKIRIYLAGGIGQMILENKKLSFSEFEQRYQANIGHSNLVGSDMWVIVQELIYSSQLKDFTVISDFQEELEPYAIPNQTERQEYINELLEECYEEAYANLYANKDILNKIVKETLDQGVISGDLIYKLAGKQRPKYDFEMSSTEKIVRSLSNWLSWTFNRMMFYDRHGAQN